ncbi:hypothetical protein B0A49_03431 [Cryomyces minteri]|uniref:Uncharacterized protein n=1 Tax=Cryomyces minteri TaxID=331657 RepID=A0A4U0XIY2_9PEZI|nr:hypothetical protein B0A49_03431 [Cryomyces minteri]
MSLIERLRADLSEKTLSSSERKVILEQLKVYGRDPNNADPIFAKAGIETLAGQALDRDLSDASREALRCLANALFLREQMRQILVDLGYAGKAAQRLKIDNRDDEFLVSRILFLMTYNTDVDFNQLKREHQIAESINQNIARHSKRYSKHCHRPSSPSPLDEMALVETLKLLFNITHYYPALVDSFTESVPHILKILSRMTVPHPPLQSPVNYLINALINLDLGNQKITSNPIFPDFDSSYNVECLVNILDRATTEYEEAKLDQTAAPLLTLSSPSNTQQLKERLRRKSKGQPELPENTRARRQMPFEEIYSFFKDITSGLHHLHTNGYIHRDLKPSNCLLHNTGHKLKVLVSDFGEVQLVNAARRSTGATGTISYCAPEVLRRESPDGAYGNFTTKSDIFSLGMIVYFMCFNGLPYRNADDLNEENEDLDQLRDEITAWTGFSDERRARPDLPERLYSSLKRLLSLDPAERPETEEILQGIKAGYGVEEVENFGHGASNKLFEDNRSRISSADSPSPAPDVHSRKLSSSKHTRPRPSKLNRQYSGETSRPQSPLSHEALLAAASLLSCVSATPAQPRARNVQERALEYVVKPKVFIISMFAPEAAVWWGIKEFNLLAKNITVPGFSPLFPDAHCTADGEVCQLVTGESEINAAVTISSLLQSRRFDLTTAYFVIAGIAGISPEVATLGSVTFARYAVQVALQYEFDPREIPANFSTGYVPQGATQPNQYPADIYGTEVFEVNQALQHLATGFARNATLNDSSAAITYRANYASTSAYAAGAAAPSVVECDVATSDVYYSGTILSTAFANYTSLVTNGSGVYCTTAQEDNATLEALLRGAVTGLIDFASIIIMRTASDFDRPYPGEAATTNLFWANQGGFGPAIQNIYLAGVKVVDGILGEWNSTFSHGVNATNYVGDIFGTLGGTPDFGPGSKFGDNPVLAKREAMAGIKGRKMGKRGIHRGRFYERSERLVVVYHQTHHDPTTGNPVSVLPLISNQTGVTHVIVAAIHLNEGPGNITLNDDPPDADKFKTLWGEIAWLQGVGIKVLGMLGGAAKGTFARLDTENADLFNAYYAPLRALIRARRLDGLDLDVEEPMSLAGIIRLIDRLRADFGAGFVITLAPVATALLPDQPHLSGFDYRVLELMRGASVSWYNTQFYCGWGDVSSTAMYDAIVRCGWRPEKVVVGVVTNPANGTGHVDARVLEDVLMVLRVKYPGQFGGVMGWEYFNSLPGDVRAPWEWAAGMARCVRMALPPAGTLPIAPTPAFPQDSLDQLVVLGFSRQQAVAALNMTGGNVEYAAGLLFRD